MRANPLAVIRRQPAAGNDTVDMGMEQEILPPSMENAEEADLGAQVFRIASNFQECLRYCLKQEVVEFDLVLEYEFPQFMRQRENDMEITRR